MALKMTLRKANIGALLKSARVRAELKARADRIAAAAGEGMVASVQVGQNRARASVITATSKARENEARRRSLTRALDAGR
jgi:tRNA A37 threonylcarbamoyltransferase TsaD